MMKGRKKWKWNARRVEIVLNHVILETRVGARILRLSEEMKNCKTNSKRHTTTVEFNGESCHKRCLVKKVINFHRCSCSSANEFTSFAANSRHHHLTSCFDHIVMARRQWWKCVIFFWWQWTATGRQVIRQQKCTHTFSFLHNGWNPKLIVVSWRVISIWKKAKYTRFVEFSTPTRILTLAFSMASV